jgi:Mg2+/Co2+ transporter CorB
VHIAVSATQLTWNDTESVDNLAEGIALVFNKAFDWNLTKEECLTVAENIWKKTKGI